MARDDRRDERVDGAVLPPLHWADVPVLVPLGVRLGVIDKPDGGRKLHANPTPLVGGVGLVNPSVREIQAALAGA